MQDNKFCGPDKQVPPKGRSEGHACRARESGMEDPTWRGGRDKRVPPKSGPDKRVPPKGRSEGHACRARESGMENPTWRGGRDERVPPKSGPDKQVPPRDGHFGFAKMRYRSLGRIL